MKKTLVTGGYGLVGSTINADVKIGREYDLRNQQDVQNMFEVHKPTHVIHCAARVGGVGGNMKYKGEYFYDNIMINTNVIEQARLSGVQRLVNFLSVCVYPDNVEYPLTENKIHIGEPHFSNDAYAYAKRMSDIQIRAYRQQYGINYTSIIPTNVYGPRDNFSIEEGHVIPMLIHKMYLAQRNNTDFVVWGNGKSLREFIFSKDLGKIAEWVLNEYMETEPIIASTSQEISIGDLVDLLVNAFNFKGNVIFDTSKPNGQFRRPSDNSKLRNYLKDFQFTPIEVGIKETVEWFQNHYDTGVVRL